MSINEIMDCFINPVKSKILIEICNKGQMTAKQLQQTNIDIPQATLYRTLNRLVEAGMIEVVAENRVRGAVEKVYAASSSVNADVNKIVNENHGEGYLQLFANYALGIMNEFKEYSQRPNIDILHDGSGFSASPINVTPEELQELALKIAEVTKPYRENIPAPNRKMRTMALIFTPPRDLEE